MHALHRHSFFVFWRQKFSPSLLLLLQWDFADHFFAYNSSRLISSKQTRNLIVSRDFISLNQLSAPSPPLFYVFNLECTKLSHAWNKSLKVLHDFHKSWSTGSLVTQAELLVSGPCGWCRSLKIRPPAQYFSKSVLEKLSLLKVMEWGKTRL